MHVQDVRGDQYCPRRGASCRRALRHVVAVVASDQIAKGLPRLTAMLLWEGPNAWAIVILFILAGLATSLKVTQGTANRASGAVVVGLERYAIKGLDADVLAEVKLTEASTMPNDRRW